jgi:prepilin peptidase CpaA
VAGGNLFLVFATLVAIVGAWFDWRSGRRADTGEGMEGEIPNSLTLGALAIAPIAWLAYGWKVGGARAGLEAAGFSVAGALTCALIPIFMWRGGAMGGGDVKLLAAIGAIVRPLVGIEAEFYAFAAAAILAPARLAWEGKLLATLGRSFALAMNPLLPKDKKREIPKEAMTWFRFGPAIAVGTLIATILHWQLGRAP